jgi:hypothetical protein
MKKVKIQNKLSLDKMTVAKLNDQDTKEVNGGINLSKLLRCGTFNRKCQSRAPRCSPTEF